MNSQSSVMTRRRFLGAASAVPLWAVSTGQVSAQRQGQAKIKIGQMGTQHAHAYGKMEAIRRLPELYEVVGVVEPDGDARLRAQEHEVFKDLPFVSEAALLETPGLQAVAVETAVRQLMPTALRCLEAGAHIHVDKPAGANLSACRRMHERARAQGRTVQMGYMFRYNAGFEFLFHVLREGWLGEVTEVSGMIGKRASDSLRDDLSQYEGGGMFELGCHLIDAVVTVLGKPLAVQSFNRRMRPERDTFIDNQLALFEYSRAIATIRCNHMDPFGSPRRQFNVSGTRGTVEIRPLEAPRVRLALDRDQGPYKKGYQDVVLAQMDGRYTGEFRDLAQVIRGEKALAWDADHDLAVQEAVLRASGVSVD